MSNLNDVPQDSLRERVERTIDLISSGTYGVGALTTTLADELRAALELPDFSVGQQQAISSAVDGLRYSGSLHRPKMVAQKTHELVNWLMDYSRVLADGVERAEKALLTSEKNMRFYSRESDRYRMRWERLMKERSAVRNFFAGKDDTDDDD
jgi:hypothetical protein